MNRRNLIKKSLFAGALSLAPFKKILAQTPSKPIISGNNLGGFKKINFGEIELYILTDGHILQSPVQPFMAPKASSDDVNKILEENFRSTTDIDLAMNVLLVKSQDKLILIDAGMGIFADNNTGILLQSIAKAGFSPDDITDILISHAHPDHIGGLVDRKNELIYPNAKYFISKIEHNFWEKATIDDFKNSELRKQPDLLNQLIPGLKNVLKIIQPKLNYYNFDKPLYNLFSFQLAPGHTPGLTLITLHSGKEKLIYIADLIHSDILLFPHPDWGFSGDTDIDLATTTRKKVLLQLADTKIKAFAYHLPWPGLGYTKKSGGAYQWIPEIFQTP
ncbi:MBL fold metallo-hydrolase [Pedobacter punctiformis]|uniref:MBL fold metallo-hydrolase n=1 Tax=Pedobacter punctiformis TaxID=3004097 RepID=A0ABT4L658_9SPHI|nr:MBL fold metallo-hydrolase [Pedobacter sp. HCMS5-2]MCZ4243167.1 MBL fold metallo-hydrolase [Pedobacter sp. HCMS5-2]